MTKTKTTLYTLSTGFWIGSLRDVFSISCFSCHCFLLSSFLRSEEIILPHSTLRLSSWPAQDPPAGRIQTGHAPLTNIKTKCVSSGFSSSCIFRSVSPWYALESFRPLLIYSGTCIFIVNSKIRMVRQGETTQNKDNSLIST